MKGASERANGRATQPVLTSEYHGAPSKNFVKITREGQSDGPLDEWMQGHMHRWKDGLTDGPTDGPELSKRGVVISNKPDRHKSRACNSLSQCICLKMQKSNV